MTNNRPSRPIPPEILELSNGIPVVLQNYESTVAATYWWVKVGSTDEAPHETGFAHFLEHMLFKDAAAKETGQASTGQTARVIESLGGDINAYTSFDQTVYHVTSAALHWEKILHAFCSMAKPQRFLKADFEREREVILEELRKNEDSPSRQLFQSLFTGTFSKHPYGRPVIGFERILKKAKLSELESFYRRHYVSARMGLILVGPLGTDGKRRQEILKILEKYFGKKVLKPTKAVETKRPKEVELRTTCQWVAKPFDVKTPTLSFSFRVPELAHPDTPALDVLSGILGMGELSRFYQRLFYETSLATDVSGGLYVPKDPGMLYFQAEVDSSGKLESAADEMFKVIRKLGEEGPAPEELSRIVVNIESERLYSTQTADGVAGRLGFLKYGVGDLSFDQQYLDDLKAVDPARIQEVVRKYLDHRRMSGVILYPKSEQAIGTRSFEEKSRNFLSWEEPKEIRVGATSKKAKENLPDLYTLPSGLRVCFYSRPGSHVFSVHASALGGVRLELPSWGVSNLMSLVWNKGTPSRNAREISGIVEGSAAGLDGFSGRNTVGLQLTGLSRDWHKLSSLFSDVLLHPEFPDSEVDHARRVAEDTIRSIDDHSSQLCSKLFLETLFTKHPYGKFSYGSPETLKGFHSKILKGFHRSWIRPERLVLSVCGDVQWTSVENWINELERKVKEVPLDPSFTEIKTHFEDEEVLKAPRWVERSLAREQLHIIVGGLGARLDSPDRHALRVLQTILGGQSGRLFIELREKKSLAYTVAPLSFEGIERGYVGTYIACSPQKREEAITGIAAVLEKLAAKGPSQDEMKRAKEFFMGRRAMDLQGDASLASYYGLEHLYGLPFLTEAEVRRKIDAVTTRDVQRVCKKYFLESHMVTCAVG